jgi:hypothetical protein
MTVKMWYADSASCRTYGSVIIILVSYTNRTVVETQRNNTERQMIGIEEEREQTKYIYTIYIYI